MLIKHGHRYPCNKGKVSKNSNTEIFFLTSIYLIETLTFLSSLTAKIHLDRFSDDNKIIPKQGFTSRQV